MKRIAPKTRSASKQIAEMAIPQVAVAPNWPGMHTQSISSETKSLINASKGAHVSSHRKY
jgi:hypothetical protein